MSQHICVRMLLELHLLQLSEHYIDRGLKYSGASEKKHSSFETVINYSRFMLISEFEEAAREILTKWEYKKGNSDQEMEKVKSEFACEIIREFDNVCMLTEHVYPVIKGPYCPQVWELDDIAQRCWNCTQKKKGKDSRDDFSLSASFKFNEEIFSEIDSYICSDDFLLSFQESANKKGKIFRERFKNTGLAKLDWYETIKQIISITKKQNFYKAAALYGCLHGNLKLAHIYIKKYIEELGVPSLSSCLLSGIWEAFFPVDKKCHTETIMALENLQKFHFNKPLTQYDIALICSCTKNINYVSENAYPQIKRFMDLLFYAYPNTINELVYNENKFPILETRLRALVLSRTCEGLYAQICSLSKRAEAENFKSFLMRVNIYTIKADHFKNWRVTSSINETLCHPVINLKNRVPCEFLRHHIDYID